MKFFGCANNTFSRNTVQQAAQQGPASDRLQPALRLVPRLRFGFRRQVSLVVLLLARGATRGTTFEDRLK